MELKDERDIAAPARGGVWPPVDADVLGVTRPVALNGRQRR
jgi:hypothetical protein